jgi:hypothetical protein
MLARARIANKLEFCLLSKALLQVTYNFEACVANALQPVRNFELKAEIRSIL